MNFNNLNYHNLIISILILLAAGYIYDKFKLKVELDDKTEELNIIKKYLLNEKDYSTIERLSSINKPILWIHLDYQKNSRKWLSFGSRNTNELNQDYLYLTIRSIINKCSDDFHIVLIDDDCFDKLLDKWNIDINKISDPQKEYFRKLGLVKTLHKYGGILLEPSFILFKSLKPIYDKVLSTQKMCVAEFPNKSSNSHIMFYMPNMGFIGCVKNCPKMREFQNHLEILLSKDYTNEINMEDLINKWLFTNTQNNNINYIDGTYIGVKDSKNKMIQIEDLIGSTFLELDSKSYALYIPHKELLTRKNYNWFAYLSVEQVLTSSTNIGKYLLLSNS